jgi:glutamyl-tRNA(Gln) amidotransferase subunit E
VIFVADSEENSTDALRAVAERAKELLTAVPAETRTAKEDGTTRYMRPRPGAARMYPETDIPPTLITADLVEKIHANLPESSDKKQQRLTEQFGLNEKLAKQIIDSEYNLLFETIVKESGVSGTTVAVFLTETLKALRRDGIPVEHVSEENIKEIFLAVGSGELAKEVLADVFSWLAKNEGKGVQDATEALGLQMLSQKELEQLVNRIIAENSAQIGQLGKGAFGLVMGLVMKEARGKAAPDAVSKMVRQKLQ